MVQVKVFENAKEEDINAFLRETKGKLVSVLQSNNVIIVDKEHINIKGLNITIVYDTNMVGGIKS